MLKVEYHGYEAWKRAGLAYGRHFDTQSDEKKQIAQIMLESARRCQLKEPLDGEIAFFGIFYKKWPRTIPKKKRQQKVFWNTKPDIDNLSKFVFDTMQRQAGLITDDSRICLNVTLKLWGEYDYTIFFFDKWDLHKRFAFNYPWLDIDNMRYHVDSRRCEFKGDEVF